MTFCIYVLYIYIRKIEILLYFKTKYYNIDVTPQIKKKKEKKRGFGYRILGEGNSVNLFLTKPPSHVISSSLSQPLSLSFYWLAKLPPSLSSLITHRYLLPIAPIVLSFFILWWKLLD